MKQVYHPLALLLSAFLMTNIPTAPCQSARQPSSPKQGPEKSPNPVPIAGIRFDSGNRRDPFLNYLSLRKGPVDEELLETLAATAGIGGMRISEVGLAGTSLRGDTFTAVVRGTDKRSYFVREGDRLRDGYVKKIQGDAVLFVHEIKMRSGKVNIEEISKRLRPN